MCVGCVFGCHVNLMYHEDELFRIIILYKYMYLFLLTNPMSPCLSLKVVLGVPIRVEYDHGVGRGQVDPQTPCTGREKETEVL